MCYLPIFLSGEYFISPFKYHFHTETARVCPAVVFSRNPSLWNISVSAEVTICLRISGGLLIRERRYKLWIFIKKTSWKRHEATEDLGLNFKCCSYLLMPLWSHRWNSTKEISLVLPLSLPFFSPSPSCPSFLCHCPEWQWFKLSDISSSKFST